MTGMFGWRRVSAEQASGRVAAEMLCPYPPGVPAVVPGEVLTPGIVAGLRRVLAQGGQGHRGGRRVAGHLHRRRCGLTWTARSGLAK